MRLGMIKRMSSLLLFGFLFLLLWNQGSPIAKAATPTFKEKEVVISGEGEVYQLEILNQVAGSKYKWSSSDKSVVKVSNQGLLTSVSGGTATIKCKITYPSKKTKNLYCTVTVTIPAEDIDINNTKLDNGAHIMLVGTSYNFNRTITPKNSSDDTFWYIDASDSDTNPDAVRIDNPYNGTVTAMRTGKIVLVAAAVQNASLEDAQASEIKDAVIIEVVGTAAEVISAEMTNSKTIKVVFGKAINSSTVINTNGTLSNNVQVSRLVGSNGETAKDPGMLSASLSGNSTVLTITAGNYFQGDYGVTFYNSIRTASGEALYQDYFKLSYNKEITYDDTTNTDTDTSDNSSDDTTTVDTVIPKLASVSLDDSGTLNIITFSEKMDFTDLTVSDATTLSSSVKAQPATISYLNNKANYAVSSDGKSLYINLSAIDSDDYNKSFQVTLSGLTDTSGNYIANNYVTAVLRTDTSAQPQARPISVLRTSYNTVSAIFTRSIKTAGYAYVNGSICYGVVDSDNPKMINYTIPSYLTYLSGVQTVSIGYWNSYNVIATDDYASRMYEFSVYFTTEDIRPILVSYSFNSELNILTLTFNENVKLLVNQGTLTYTMGSSQYDKYTGSLYYTEASTVNNVIEINLSNLSLYGDYTFTLAEGFILDYYNNKSYSKTITISKVSGDGIANQLAEPYLIQQSTVNHSLIYVYFADKIDPATAQNPDNYSVASATIQEVNLISNTSDGAVVRLTMVKGSITTTGERAVTVTGIKGYNGSASQMADYTAKVSLSENVDPQLLSVKYNATTKNTIELTFNEAIKGSMTVSVRERTSQTILGSTVTVSGTKVIITLTSIPADGTYVNIYILSNSITDSSGNESIISPELSAFINY